MRGHASWTTAAGVDTNGLQVLDACRPPWICEAPVAGWGAGARAKRVATRPLTLAALVERCQARIASLAGVEGLLYQGCLLRRGSNVEVGYRNHASEAAPKLETAR